MTPIFFMFFSSAGRNIRRCVQRTAKNICVRGVCICIYLFVLSWLTLCSVLFDFFALVDECNIYRQKLFLF